MPRIPPISEVVTNTEDEDHDIESFRNVPRTIPATNTNFNSTFLKRTKANLNDAKNQKRDGSESTASSKWGSRRGNSRRIEPGTPPSQTLRDFAKVHPEQFYSTIEDQNEDDEENNDKDRAGDRDTQEQVQDGDKVDEDTNNVPTENDFRRNNHDSEVHGVDHYGKLETQPKTDKQDTLWTEIDALDDVKNLAQTIDLYEGFPLGFEDQLQKIRESHAQVLRAMRDRNARIEEEKRHEITSKADSQSTGAQPNTNGSGDDICREASESTAKLDRQINQDSLGPTVLPDEDKYIQKMIDSIKALRT